MESSIKIGIIVPVYNKEPYLEKCIQSILFQTYKNFEAVLVDDGSGDGSGAVCDNFKLVDKRIHVIHQKNQGILAACYNGLKNLDCDYVCIVDADDWIDQNALIKVLPYMQQEIDMISFQIIRAFTHFNRISKHSYPIGVYHAEDIKRTIFPTMIWDIEKGGFGLDPSLCNKVVKRELIFRELEKAKHLSIWYGQDVAVTYTMMQSVKSLALMDDALYYHRQRQFNELPPYYLDEDYYGKLFALYQYLKDEIKNDASLMKQIDYFYAESAKYKLEVYGKTPDRPMHLFPFDKVPFGSKIILYGASTVGQAYYRQLSQIHYAEVLLWVDKAHEMYARKGVSRINAIVNVPDYDFVVVAIKNRDIVEEVRGELVDAWNIDRDKIVF